MYKGGELWKFEIMKNYSTEKRFMVDLSIVVSIESKSRFTSIIILHEYIRAKHLNSKIFQV